MIAIVNYGIGNVQAFVNIYKRLGIPSELVESAAQLESADKIILPGVGAFDWAMSKLEASGMRGCLDELVLVRKRPVLGVCVGMQMMAKSSEEGKSPGLGWIDATVRRFAGSTPEHDINLPHMGWNDAVPVGDPRLFAGMTSPKFYFLHSYYIAPAHAESIVAVTDYGSQFASAVASGNVYGVQFHPEKSHQWGIQLLKNFSEL